MDKSSLDGRHRRCLDCSRSAASKWYYANKEVAIRRVIANQEKMRIWLWELKSTLKCIKCGESHPACLDFHHRDPAQKRRAVSQLWQLGSKLNILVEIAKCDVLCANCHRKFHYISPASLTEKQQPYTLQAPD